MQRGSDSGLSDRPSFFPLEVVILSSLVRRTARSANRTEVSRCSVREFVPETFVPNVERYVGVR